MSAIVPANVCHTTGAAAGTRTPLATLKEWRPTHSRQRQNWGSEQESNLLGRPYQGRCSRRGASERDRARQEVGLRGGLEPPRPSLRGTVLPREHRSSIGVVGGNRTRCLVLGTDAS